MMHKLIPAALAAAFLLVPAAALAQADWEKPLSKSYQKADNHLRNGNIGGFIGELDKLAEFFRQEAHEARERPVDKDRLRNERRKSGEALAWKAQEELVINNLSTVIAMSIPQTNEQIAAALYNLAGEVLMGALDYAHAILQFKQAVQCDPANVRYQHALADAIRADKEEQRIEQHIQ